MKKLIVLAILAISLILIGCAQQNPPTSTTKASSEPTSAPSNQVITSIEPKFNTAGNELIEPIHIAIPDGFKIIDKVSSTEGFQFRAYGPIEEGFQTNLWITIETKPIEGDLEKFALENINITRADPAIKDVKIYNRYPINIDGVIGYNINTIITDNKGSFGSSQIIYNKGNYGVYITLSYPEKSFIKYHSLLVKDILKYVVDENKFVYYNESALTGIPIAFGPGGTISWGEKTIEKFKKYEPYCSQCMQYQPKNQTFNKSIQLLLRIEPDFAKWRNKYNLTVVKVFEEEEKMIEVKTFELIDNGTLLNVSSYSLGKYCPCYREFVLDEIENTSSN